MTLHEDWESDWKDNDREKDSCQHNMSSTIFLESNFKPQKDKPHDREKYPAVSTTEYEVLHPLDSSVKTLSLDSGTYILPTRSNLHHNPNPFADHPSVVGNIFYVNFKTANEELQGNANTQTELLKMNMDISLVTEQKGMSTGDHRYRDVTSNNYLQKDHEDESTKENLLKLEVASDDGYVSVRSRISVDSSGRKKSPPDKASKNTPVLTPEAIYYNLPVPKGLIPHPVSNGDMCTDNPDPEGDYCKLLPLGTTHETVSPKMFYNYTVREVYDCFMFCGLEQLAKTCKSGKLDGAFFKHLMNDNFSEVLSKEPFNLTLLDTFKVKTIIGGWRPNVSLEYL